MGQFYGGQTDGRTRRTDKKFKARGTVLSHENTYITNNLISKQTDGLVVTHNPPFKFAIVR